MYDEGKAAQHLQLVPISNDLFENERMLLPSNLRSICLQRPSKLEIYSILSREFIIGFVTFSSKCHRPLP